MENPAFLDSDHSVYESVRGTPLTMSQRRQRKKHLQQQHHHIPGIHNTNNAQAEEGSYIGGSQHPALIHNGRVLGVTGTPGDGAGTMVVNHMVPASRVPGMIVQVSAGNPGIHSTTTTTLYHDPSLPALYSAHINSSHPHPTEYLYSCEAPRGHEHVYQCPGQRGDHVSHRDHHVEHRQRHIDIRNHPVHLDRNKQYSNHHIDPSLDQRPDYHYGGSDYSSTEPIYAQPQLYPRDGSAGTPTLDYNNGRSSLRAISASSYHMSSTGNNTAKYLVRSDSCGESTSSSTLPTVSALLRDPNNTYTNSASTHVRHPSLRSSGRHGKNLDTSNLGIVNVSGDLVTTATPAKLKRLGVFRRCKVKFLRGEGGKRRACLLVAAFLMVLLLVLGALATVLYLTLGGGAFIGEHPKLIEVTETGSGVVEGEFRITNQNFWPGLEDPYSEEYRSMAQSIESELDSLFLGSVWSHEYNHSQVISLSEGSLVVQAQMFLNTADVAAAQKLGTAFLRGLQNRHGSEWLGQYSIDITSIRFTEVFVETPASSNTSQTPTPVRTEDPSITKIEISHPVTPLNVGWGEWGPWSSCSPCSPQYDQIRTRECRLDAGHGLLVSSIEPCLPSDNRGQLQGSSGDMETRPCLCHHIKHDNISPKTVDIPTTTTPNQRRIEEQYKQINEMTSEQPCDSCLPGEVCVGLQGESYPTCRPALDSTDRKGCGGLCVIDSEVCQALGSRAFQCHSASLCLHDEWRCDDGLCIPLIKRCDGHMNCYDHSDEQQCQCSVDQFKCGNNTSCLPVTSKCDGKMDCWDGSDEANCTTSVSVSPNRSSAMGLPIVRMGLMNPKDAMDSAKPTNINAGMEDLSQLPSSVMGGTRVVTSAMNRTAVGLSSLSNRERELLS